MRLLADIHISPRTVRFLNRLGHEVIRVDDRLPATAPDQEIIVAALSEDRAVLTQDLGFSGMVVQSGLSAPSIISLRLSDSRVDAVNNRLGQVLPAIEADVGEGVLVTVDDNRVRVRRIPL